MGKYLLKRLLHGIFSIIVVVAIVMVLIFSLLDRSAIFATDTVYSHKSGNERTIYEYQRWQEYGYVEYTLYTDYITSLETSGDIPAEDVPFAKALGINKREDGTVTTTVIVDGIETEVTESKPEITEKYIKKFTDYYESKGYEIVRLDGKRTSTGIVLQNFRPYIFAHRDLNLFTRLWEFFSGIVTIDTIHYVEDDIDNRGIEFTLFDPLYGGKFAPAIIGNGTKHKYLLYFDSTFPYIHQNLITFHLGKSYSMYKGNDLVETMTQSQGGAIVEEKIFPTGVVAETSNDLHSATYSSAKLSADNERLFGDQYFNCKTNNNGLSMVGYSFLIGIIATFLAYLLGVPLGVIMARRKDKLFDKIGTIYIVFIMAVPSLAYIFMFRSLGNTLFGLPVNFGLTVSHRWTLYVLPIISLALPSVASLMKWIRRYMIDQMNSDYVKFARSGGLSEGEIFRKHILKNAAIPIVHGIPGSILGCITGAIITEKVYAVPGTGKLLTESINKHDNGVIVGLTMFYALLSVVSLILGDILMAIVDPRISFSTSGGKR